MHVNAPRHDSMGVVLCVSRFFYVLDREGVNIDEM